MPAAEMLKVYNNIAPSICNEIFDKRNLNYELGHTSHLPVSHVTIVYNGTKRRYCANKAKKVTTTLTVFKSGIKKWWPQNCPCRLCRRYLPNSFI